MAWSPDGKRLATLGEDRAIRILDGQSGKTVTVHRWEPIPFTVDGTGCLLAWSSDGRRVCIATGLLSLQIEADETWQSAAIDLGAERTVTALALPSREDRVLLRDKYGAAYLGDWTNGSSRRLGKHLGHRFLWHPDDRRFLGIEPVLGVRGFDARRERRLGTLHPFVGDGHWVCIGPDGHWRGSKSVEKHLVYVALTDDGKQPTFSPTEFEKTFGWKNDPDKARLLGDQEK